ncbi:MAG: thioredoxin domain-containing protein, partial [Bifidobacteriaceae bacterium]|nr:thioredoxin domain-containing protein [Bifidobacteriaceae bacterium]
MINGETVEIKKDDFACQFYFKSKITESEPTVHYTIFFDFQCEKSSAFFSKYQKLLKKAVETNKATVRLVPLVWLEPEYKGYLYSIRAAHAARVVLRYQPELLWLYISVLLDKRALPGVEKNYNPDKGSDNNLASYSEKLGAKDYVSKQIVSIRPSAKFIRNMYSQSNILRLQKYIIDT